MRPAVIGGICGIALAVGGVAMTVATMNRNIMANIDAGPTHPVTDPMKKEAEKMALKPAPEFSLTSTTGSLINLEKAVDGKPTVFYFIKDGCPCSTDAEPMLQRLYQHLNRDEKVSVNFVGVIDLDPKDALDKWVKGFNPPYTVLCSPDAKAMKAFNAPNSVYITLVTPDGKIQKQWPGWSKRVLAEINSLASKLAGIEEKEFDTAYAPVEDTSGCEFNPDTPTL
jgi:peroxiredoxin